ncbi:lytic murein transglycosylase [bacterium]|nr:lytic murein transglycosylase [bacterium]
MLSFFTNKDAQFLSIMKLVLASILILAFLLPYFRTFAEDDLEKSCQWERIQNKPENLSNSDYESLLRKCLEYWQAESEAIEKDINQSQAKKNTLRNKIYTLERKIKSLNYQIYQSNIMIRDLSSQINNTQSSISKTSHKIEDIKKNLSNILQLRYEEDRRGIVEIVLADGGLSAFFDNLMALETLNTETQRLLENIKNLKKDLERQKDSMDKEKEDLEKMLRIQTIQKEQSDKTKKEQEYFLRMTEAEYQKYLQEKQETERKVAKIRERIFALIGVTKAPTFGEALKLAEYVESITGIRPAFLLAVLTQESNIGKNVGQCYLKNKNTGAGIVARTGAPINRVMKPMGLSGRKGDVNDFFAICKELSRDPYHTLVSCPMSYGWGGAMGPGQFIPSTWMLYRKRVEKVTGKPADPWNIKDSFLATAFYLADYGATKHTYSSEWKAAMIYFSGTSRKTVYNGYGFYGNNVMAIAKKLQQDIEVISSAP